MRYVFSVLILCIVALAVFGSDLKMTELYTSPKEWCNSLYIVVTGNSVSSDKYYIEDCAESTNKGTWYCNCDLDEDFEVNFVNRKSDTSSYIIDIKSTSNSVRRVVSSNQFLDNDIAVNTPIKPDTTTKNYDDTIKDIYSRLVSIESKDNAMSSRIDLMEQTVNSNFKVLGGKINNVSVQPMYDDTALKARISDMEKRSKQDFTGVGVIIVIFIMCGYMAYNEVWKVKKIGQ